MPDPSKPALPSSSSPTRTCAPGGTPSAGGADDKMICERCGQAEMFRMHAVWRCPNCGYKTDCCGW